MHRLVWVSVLLLLALGALIGCGEPAPPRIVEVDLPQETRDPVGPYLATAVFDGAESGRVVWQVESEGAAASEPESGAMVDAGSAWEGRIPGRPPLPGTAYTVWVEASNAAGTTRSASARFRVLDPDGACLVDGACLRGEICSGGRCRVPPAVCGSDADCGQDFYCPIAGEACRFRPTVCAEDGDCAAGDVCRDGRCGPQAECFEDADCPDGRCAEGRCVPRAGCDLDGDCADGESCVDGACAVACVDDGQCAPDEVCRDMRCVPGGAVPCPGGCPAGQRCLPSEARCVACTADGHCPGGHCDLAAWACAPRERGRPCTPCSPQTLCGGGYACAGDVGGTCIPRCNAECEAGCEDVCAVPPDRLCGGSACDVDLGCDSGVCLAGWCEPRQYCVRDADCAADRRCADGRCVFEADACRRPGDCGAGEICLGGRCSPGRPIDPCSRCTVDADCPSSALCVPFDGQFRCAALCGTDCPGESLECAVVDAGLLVCLGPDVTCPVDACGVDALEPNDDARTATRMLLGAVLSGALCERDADWLAIEAPEGAQLFVQTQGVMRISVFDSDLGAQRELDLPPGGSVEFALPLNTAFVRLTTVADGEFVWDAVLGPPAPPGCEDDGFEENDDADEATVLGNGADIRAAACPGDLDWYAVRTRGRAGTLRIDGGDDVLDIRLLDVGERPLGVLRGAGRLEMPLPPGEDEIYAVVSCAGCRARADYRLRTLLE